MPRYFGDVMNFLYSKTYDTKVRIDREYNDERGEKILVGTLMIDGQLHSDFLFRPSELREICACGRILAANVTGVCDVCLAWVRREP